MPDRSTELETPAELAAWAKALAAAVTPAELARLVKGYWEQVRSPRRFAVDLLSDAKLLAWFKVATVQKKLEARDTYADRLNVFTAAERALEGGDAPSAWFAYNVGRKQWELISEAQEVRAQHRLRRLGNSHR